MKAIVIARYGGPEVLEYTSVPDPQPAEGEVLVHVEAAGVNFADTMQSRGTYPTGPRPPFIPGLEFAGTIATTGEKVMGLTPRGAYAEKIAVPHEALFPRGPLSAAEGAAFPVTSLTAYFAFSLAHATAGQKVLIHAAAGGVGTAAVQIGKALGLETFGTASSDEKLARLQELGLDHGINYRKQDYEKAIAELTGGRGVDVVLEMLGGEHTAKSLRCLAPLGQMIAYGSATGAAPQFDFMTMFGRNLAVRALWLTPIMQNRAMVADAWQRLSQWLAMGKLRPVVGHTIPLAQAAEAHRLLLERKNYGKIVLGVPVS